MLLIDEVYRAHRRRSEIARLGAYFPKSDAKIHNSFKKQQFSPEKVAPAMLLNAPKLREWRDFISFAGEFMDSFEKMIAEAIGRRGMLRRGKVVVALSGGADSAALLLVLHRLGYHCVAAHCNFHLRGDESDRDEAHCRRLAAEIDVEIVTTDFDVKARCEATGESLEMACRSLRYEWFEKVMKQFNAQAVAVGHHLEDNVETLFLNLIRGTGIAGVAGIHAVRGYIIRPLLEVTRREIENYLRRNNIEWVDDSTNAANDFSRNRLRNIVLPALEASFPGGIEMIARSIGNIAEGATFFKEAVARKRKQYFNAAERLLKLSQLIENEPMARLLMVEWLREYSIDAPTVDRILSSANESGRYFSPTTEGAWLLDRGTLRYVVACEAIEAQSVTLDKAPFAIEFADGMPERLPSYALTALFDPAILDDNPKFELRSWRKGDRIKPFGMTGSKKISDIFRDATVADDEKHRPIILTRNGEIIWVIGLRHSRLFPVTGSRHIRLTFRPYE